MMYNANASTKKVGAGIDLPNRTKEHMLRLSLMAVFCVCTLYE